MNNLCIIPARGGSKRIPRKNIKEFLGKPIIAYSIKAAVKSNLFSEVIVSTEDKEIAEVAIKYGAKVPFMRSEKSADDNATTLEVINEVVKKYEERDQTFDSICCIYATAPFVSEFLLRKSYDSFETNKFDALFPVIPFGFPIQRALRVKNHKSEFIYPIHLNTRSQDLEKSYQDAGQFYWMSYELALNGKSIMTENTGAYIISELEGQDIDNEIDWKLAELKYELLQSIK
jgi:pseudaminic acid cytidylyltransferase